MLTGVRPTEGDFGLTPDVIHAQEVWDAFRDPRKMMFRNTPDTKWDKHNDGTYTLRVKPSLGGSSSSGGSYQGDYDNTKSYRAGDWVRVKTPVTVAGIAVPAGNFAVPPGVSVPANGTAFQVPQYPEPTAFGATPSDKVYWHVTQLSCDSLL